MSTFSIMVFTHTWLTGCLRHHILESTKLWSWIKLYPNNILVILFLSWRLFEHQKCNFEKNYLWFFYRKIGPRVFIAKLSFLMFKDLGGEHQIHSILGWEKLHWNFHLKKSCRVNFVKSSYIIQYLNFRFDM